MCELTPGTSVYPLPPPPPTPPPPGVGDQGAELEATHGLFSCAENHHGEKRVLQPAETKRCQGAPAAAVRHLPAQQVQEAVFQVDLAGTPGLGLPGRGQDLWNLLCVKELNLRVGHCLIFSATYRTSSFAPEPHGPGPTPQLPVLGYSPICGGEPHLQDPSSSLHFAEDQRPLPPF